MTSFQIKRYPMKQLLLVLVCCCLVNVSAQKNSWAKFLGPNEDGISPETGINKDWNKKPPKELWRVKMTDHGHSIPSIAGGKVFILDHKDDTDIVKALDLKTGKELWKYEYKDAKKQKYGFTRVLPVYHNGLLYTVSRMGKVFCFEAKDGSVKWKLDYLKDFNGKIPRFGYTGSPVIDGNKLILAPQGPGAMIITVDLKTGNVIWKGGGDINSGYSTPGIAKVNGQKQYLFANKFGLAGIDPENGNVLWKTPFPTKHGNNIAVPILFDRNKIFITAGYNHGCATFEIKDNHAKKLWENGVLKAHFNSPVLVDNLIYGIGDPGKLICLDPMTGDVRWEKRGFGKGGLLVIDGTIIAIAGKSGKVVMVKLTPEKYVEMGRISPLSKDINSWVPPVIADKKLIVRNRSELVCLDLSE